jgi:Ca2+-binding EF-hand superfamily protein
MLLQAVATAGLIVTIIVVPAENWSLHGFVAYLVAWGAPLFQWLWLVPKVVTKFAIITSVEYMKKAETIHEVAFEVKRKRIQQTLKLMRIIKLKGRAERLGGGCIDPAEFERGLKGWMNLPKKKRADMEGFFKLFDSDGSGEIDASEMKQVLNTMGLVTEEAEESVLTLMKMVDRDGDGTLGLDEFKVLMVLALKQPTGEEQKEEIQYFFDKFDEDNSGHVTIAEMAEQFAQLGCPLEEEEIRDIVYDCFKRPMEKMTKEEFYDWIQKTDDLLAEAGSE